MQKRSHSHGDEVDPEEMEEEPGARRALPVAPAAAAAPADPGQGQQTAPRGSPGAASSSADSGNHSGQHEGTHVSDTTA